MIEYKELLEELIKDINITAKQKLSFKEGAFESKHHSDIIKFHINLIIEDRVILSKKWEINKEMLNISKNLSYKVLLCELIRAGSALMWEHYLVVNGTKGLL